MVTNSSIRRAFVAKGWSKKPARQRAIEQNANLRDYYLHNLSELMNLDVANALGSNGQVGHHLARPLCK